MPIYAYSSRGSGLRPTPPEPPRPDQVEPVPDMPPMTGSASYGRR
jgi:hypothetical protein